MDPQIENLLNHQISVEKVQERDGRGAITYEMENETPVDPTVVACYIAGNVQMIRNIFGEEVVSTLTIFISGTGAAEVGLNDTKNAHKYRITLPDGRQPPILAIHPYYDDRGALHYVVVNL